MRSDKLISVIVAVYNSEKYLRQCLDSILAQSYGGFELICVDDGSTDSSADILSEYAGLDRRISVYHKENEGLGAASARNLGLDKATGDFVIILDSDDFFEESMFERALKKAEDNDADIVVFGGYEYDDRSGKRRKINGILNEGLIPDKEVFSFRDCPEHFFQISQGMAWNKMFRREFLSRHGISFQRIRFTDDAYFTFMNMALAERITVLNESFCNYRINTGTNQTGKMSGCPDSAYLPYVKLKESLENAGLFTPLKHSFVNLAVEFARFFYDNTGTFDSFKYLHDKLKYEVFEKLELSGHPADYYRDKRCAAWVDEVLRYSAEEMLFISARAHGDNSSTTGIMRFQFPYDRIPAGSRIAIIGARIAGQYYYSQAVLNGNIDVAVWADDENPKGLSQINKLDTLKDVCFDYALISYHEKKRIEKAVIFLKNIGTEDEKIIIGEETPAI